MPGLKTKASIQKFLKTFDAILANDNTLKEYIDEEDVQEAKYMLNDICRRLSKVLNTHTAHAAPAAPAAAKAAKAAHPKVASGGGEAEFQSIRLKQAVVDRNVEIETELKRMEMQIPPLHARTEATKQAWLTEQRKVLERKYHGRNNPRPPRY